MIGKPNRIALVNTKAEDAGWFMVWAGTIACSIGLLTMTCSKLILTPKDFCDAVKQAADDLKND